MKKAILILIIILLLATPVLSSSLQEVEQIVITKLDENQVEIKQSIDDTYLRCRDDMNVYANSLAEEYYDDLQNVLWKDRAITFFLIFFALFTGKVFFRIWDFKNKRKIHELETLGKKEIEAKSGN